MRIRQKAVISPLGTSCETCCTAYRSLSIHSRHVSRLCLRGGESPSDLFGRPLAACDGEAGLADVVCHGLRHTATTAMRRAEVDALTAMKIRGRVQVV
jgi:hypothetical protein